MYIADQLGAIGGEELNLQPKASNFLIAEIDIQLHKSAKTNTISAELTDADIEIFLKNESFITGGEEYLSAVAIKFPLYEFETEIEDKKKKPSDDDDDDDDDYDDDDEKEDEDTDVEVEIEESLPVIDRKKWKDACRRGELPLPPKMGVTGSGRDILWYDTSEQKMLYFRADRLDFIYDPELKKQIPVPVLMSTKSTDVSNNGEEILSWIEENQEELHVEAVDYDQRSVTVKFPRYVDDIEMKPIVEQALYAARFRYEISDA